MLLRHALAKSINTVSVIITERVTADRIAELARKMGIKSKLPSTNSIALGSGEVTPLEMTNAVATLAAGGKAAAPKFIEAIDGVATQASPAEQVIKPEVAYVVTNMMESVVKSGTGHLAKELGVTIAGKTGTSNDARDVWFIGMTPDYVIGVWIGYDAPKAMGKETGGTIFGACAAAMSSSRVRTLFTRRDRYVSFVDSGGLSAVAEDTATATSARASEARAKVTYPSRRLF